MLLNSVISRNSTLDNPAEPEVVFDSPAKYGDWPADKARDAATAAIDALFAEYRPGLKKRYVARAAGHYALRVSDSSSWRPAKSSRMSVRLRINTSPTGSNSSSDPSSEKMERFSKTDTAPSPLACDSKKSCVLAVMKDKARSQSPSASAA